MSDPVTFEAARPPVVREGFIGWRMVGIAFTVDFVAVGFFFYSYGVFLKPIAAALSGSRFAIALALSIANVVGALLAPFIGRALDRLPIRRIMIVGAFSVAAGFTALSQMTELWHLYLVMGTLLAAGMSMMGNIASAKLVSNWFIEARGRALGIATIGISLSGMVMPGVATWLISAVGWRGGFGVYAAATVAVVVPMVALFVIDRPEDVGQRPDGGRGGDGSGDELQLDRPWRTRELLRNWNFWVIAVPFSLAFSSLSAVLIHMVPYASDSGIPLYRAALIASIAAGAGALGKPIFGHLIDRVDARLAIGTSLFGQLVGLVLFLEGTGFAWMLVAGVVFGFSMGGVVPLHGAVTARAFGRFSFGKALGLLRPVQIPIHMIGPPLAGWIFDSTGSYDAAFQIFVGFYAVAIAAIGWLRLAPVASDHQARAA